MSTLLFLISIALLSQLSITGVRAAAGDVGDACTSSDSCTDSHAYCNSDKKCVCNTGFGQKGTKCVRSAGQPCDAGMCLDNGVCDSNSKCTCNTTSNFSAGSDGAEMCACKDSYALKRGGGICVRQVSTSCTADTDCVTNAKCDSTTKTCMCDDTKNAELDMTTLTCKCKTNYALKSDGTCALQITKSDCGTDDSKCVDKGKCNIDTCECDTTNNFEPDSTGLACKCKANYALKKDGTCALQITKSDCGTDNTKCVDNGKCNSGTCECDDTKHAEADASGLACKCEANYAFKADGKTCALQITKTDCASDDTKCVDNGKCNSGTCECDNTKHAEADDSGLACKCEANYALKADHITCALQITKTDCGSDDSKCVDNGKCNSDTCGCDDAKNAEPDSTGLACKCKKGYAKMADGTCKRTVEATTCSKDSDCVHNAKCDSTTGTCQCDDAKNAERDNAGTGCKCKTNYAAKSDGSCGLQIGQSGCGTDANKCVDGAKCPSGTCECDGNKHFEADGNDACKCASTHHQVGAVCLGKTGQTCSTADDCVNGAGVVCAAASGASSKTCQCDTSNNFTAATSAISCTCATNYKLRNDGTCGLIIGQACTKGGKPCIDRAVCDAKTSKCVCDEANRVKAAATATADVCECIDDAVPKADGSCGSKVGKPCTQKSATDVCVANAKCDAKTFNCMCDGGASSVMDDGTCKMGGGGGGAAGVVASLGLLTAGLLVTSRLI